MLKRKFILPVSIFAGVLHLFVWWNFAGIWTATGTSIIYAILVYWSYRYLERKRTRVTRKTASETEKSQPHMWRF